VEVTIRQTLIKLEKLQQLLTFGHSKYRNFGAHWFCK